MPNPLENVQALTFDLFGTVLDLGGSLTPHIAPLLEHHGAEITAEDFWRDWRARQRIEQYQDTIMMLGHGRYLTIARRALRYVLSLHRIAAGEHEITHLMDAWQELSPFPEVLDALGRLQARYRLVALSNGEPEFLRHLVHKRIGFPFDEVISVEVVGAFKPHPGIYRRAAALLNLEVNRCLMVSANSFDVMGARSCGYRGAFVNRYALPYEDTTFRPDVTVADFAELADALL